MILRRLAAAVFLTGLLLSSSARAQEEDEQVPAKFTVLDLVFTVEDLAWTVEDLRLKETDTEITIELAADVLFEFDSADLLPGARNALEKVAEVIGERAKGSCRIEGHTDGKGSASYNMGLSERRAKSVRDWLTKHSRTKGLKISTKGFGATKPVAPNAHPDGTDDPAGRAKNRRVEIVLTKR